MCLDDDCTLERRAENVMSGAAQIFNQPTNNSLFIFIIKIMGDGGVVFENCIGSDINLWKKGPGDETFEIETYLLYDEPKYRLKRHDIGSTWKFQCNITRRYLLGNGKETFSYEKHEGPKIRVKITTPLYTLQKLCEYTIVTRLLANRSRAAIDDLEIPALLKTDLKKTAIELTEIVERSHIVFYDWSEMNC